MELWFTSDSHFSHYNIIKYSNRPFKSVEEMDECMIDRWNEVVKVNDHIYHLGDVTMSRGRKVQQEEFIRLIGRLNGHKRLILGNHDHFPAEVYLKAGFRKIKGPGRWTDRILFSHYPVHPGSIGSATANVHGHIHANPSPAPVVGGDGQIRPYINVCVEVTDYRPVSFSELQQKITTKRMSHVYERV